MVVSIDPSSGRAARFGERAEVDVLQTGVDQSEAVARIAVGQNVEDRAAGEETRGKDLVPFAIAGDLVAVDDLHPDPAARRVDEVLRSSFDLHASVRKHRHAMA